MARNPLFNHYPKFNRARIFSGGVHVPGVLLILEENRCASAQFSRGRAMSSPFPRRLACWSLASVLVFATVVSAQSDNRLEQIRRLNRVAAQKAEADIRDAVKEAVSLIKSDPSTALEILEAALNTAEKDTALSETQRDSLKKLVNGHIRDAKGAGGKSEAKEANTARQKEAKPRKDDERSRVADEARDTIERARAGIRQSREVRGKQASGLAGVDR